MGVRSKRDGETEREERMEGRRAENESGRNRGRRRGRIEKGKESKIPPYEML